MCGFDARCISNYGVPSALVTTTNYLKGMRSPPGSLASTGLVAPPLPRRRAVVASFPESRLIPINGNCLFLPIFPGSRVDEILIILSPSHWLGLSVHPRARGPRMIDK
jgi:hypothetical protein